VLLLGPLPGVGLGRERAARLLVQIGPRVLRPRGEREPPSGAAHAGELGCGAFVVRGEDHAERGRDSVELRVGVRKLLGVAHVESALETFRSCRAARFLELVGRDVDGDDLGACASGPQRHPAGAAGDVEHAIARPDRKRPDDAVVDRRERLGEALVARPAPDVGGGTHHAAEHTGVVGDLFSDAADRHARDVAPLAQRLRPAALGEFVGQAHVLGEGSALRRAIEEDRVHSSILYGPPGSGKTTLARIVAASTGAAFEELSAVSATVKDVREVLARARERLGTTGRRTILFLDEIHRFNKAQQDALLPGVESGLVTLIGATTENPYYEVNSALISRTQVYELESLSEEELAEIVRRGAAELDVELAGELVALVARRSGGDARSSWRRRRRGQRASG